MLTSSQSSFQRIGVCVIAIAFFFGSDAFPLDETIESHRSLLRDSVKLARQRAVTPLTEEMLEVLKEARREKIRNKTREKERERRGEVLRSTLRRRRQTPPAHVLERMSEAERRKDRIQD